MSKPASVEHLDALEKKLRFAQGMTFSVTSCTNARILEIERYTNTLDLGVAVGAVYVQISVRIGNCVALVCPWTDRTLELLPVTCCIRDILSALGRILAAFY